MKFEGTERYVATDDLRMADWTRRVDQSPT